MVEKDYPLKSEHPRYRILDAGRKLFAELGYERTTVSLICKEAGVNRAMVSYYYGGKLALFQEIIELSNMRFLNRLREGVYLENGAEKRLKTFIGYIVEFYISEPEITEIMIRELGSNFAHVGDILERYLIQILSIITDVIQEGIDTGLFDKWESPIQIAYFVFGAINSHFVVHKILKRTNVAPFINKENSARITEHLYRLIHKGISLDETSS